MAKKKLFLGCFLVAILSFTVTIVQASVLVDIKSNITVDGKYMINITGKTDTAVTGVSLTVQKDFGQEITEDTIAANVIYIDETVSGNDGSFSFEFPMNPNSVAGEYTAVVYADNQETPAIASYFYISKESIKTLLSQLNGITAVADFYPIFKEENNVHILNALGLTINDYLSLSDTEKENTCSVLLNEKANVPFTEASLQTKFNSSLTLAKVNSAVKNTEVNTVLLNFGQYINVPTGEGSDFDIILKGGKGEEFFAYIRSQDYITLKDFTDKYAPKVLQLKTEIRTETALKAVNSASYDEMENILIQYNDLFKIDFDGRYKEVKSLDKPVLFKALVGKSFKSTTNVKDVFDEKVIELTPINTGGSSSGGGGRTSSSTVFVAEPIENKNDNPTSPASEVFDDLQNVSWAKKSIEYLKNAGIIQGTNDKKFEPDKNVTREQFIKMLILAFDLVDKNAQCDFEDVAQNEWYYTYIASAKKLNITNGMNEKSFGIGQNITREEMAAMAYRTAKLANVSFADTENSIFADDSNISDFAKDAVYKMKAANIINGVEGNVFLPSDSATRAQSATIIYRLILIGQEDIK